VAAAVIVPVSCIASEPVQWVDIGARVDDSKRLTPEQRERAYSRIVELAAVGVGIVPADVVDERNILQARLLAMQHAVDDLHVQPDVVLVDGLHTPRLSFPCRPIVQGDHLSYSIACASIVAKVLRDALMTFYHRVFPEYDFHRHKGYGTSRHLDALRRCGVSPLHRATFQPVADALRSVRPFVEGRSDAATTECNDGAAMVATPSEADQHVLAA